MDNTFNKIYIISFFVVIFASATFAGPPFNTDDPEPVDFLHWEFYVASSYQFGKYDDNATLPHFEVNYGAIPNVQVHLLTGMGYVKENASHGYGFTTAELGLKYRFINDDDGLQIGIFPLIELPTASKESLIGNNNLQTFLPLWIQKKLGEIYNVRRCGLLDKPG